MEIDLDEFRDIELAEYMANTRPFFTQRALCRGTIYPEIEEAKQKAALRGKEQPVDISTTFFPSRGGASKVTAAKRICDKCPVQWDCFEYAYEGHEPAGVWGGASTSERDDAHDELLTVSQAFVKIHGKKQLNAKTK